MSRAPSEKTQLGNAERMVRDLQDEVRNLVAESGRYRARATQAEQQVVEWKARFDKLLEFRKALIGE
jgi:hypothetical protein